ncbi:MAG: hypothetical protein HY547_02455 [Elusimicrobia bacterium]|nr:hypothetical protein [Elusimicrobiota bacterium]
MCILLGRVIPRRSRIAFWAFSGWTNKPFKNWNEVFQDTAVATAIAERLVENEHLIKIEGASYRVKKRKARQLGLEK